MAFVTNRWTYAVRPNVFSNLKVSHFTETSSGISGEQQTIQQLSLGDVLFPVATQGYYIPNYANR